MPALPLVLLALLAAPGAAGAAGAQPPAPGEGSGLLFALRAGFGLPFGDVEERGPALADVVGSKIPLGMEVGYRFDPRVRGALYFDLSPASLDPSCPADASCTGYDVRFGVVLRVHLAPAAFADPWIGVGLGIEILDATVALEAPAAPGASELRWMGVEVPVVEGGLDLAISDLIAVGPYASVSIGWFTSDAVKPPGGATSTGAIDDRATHGWAELGLRATLRL
jgi:hypothetical protein